MTLILILLSILYRLEKLRYGLEQPGQDRGFHVFPLVYCVAYNETYKTRFYKKSLTGSYMQTGATLNLMKKINRDDFYYIRATGSCKGKKGPE